MPTITNIRSWSPPQKKEAWICSAANQGVWWQAVELNHQGGSGHCDDDNDGDYDDDDDYDGNDDDVGDDDDNGTDDDDDDEKWWW